MTITAVVGVIGLSCMALLAQNTTQPVTALEPKPGVVSGRVFAITVGGDIKPARQAKAYLLYADGSLAAGIDWYTQLSPARAELPIRGLEDEEKVATDANWLTLMKATIAAAAPKDHDRLIDLSLAETEAELAVNMEQLEIRRSRIYNSGRWSDELMCRRDLLIYDKALLGVRKWRWEHKTWDQLLSAEADEEGQLRIVVPRSGKYLLIVRGRAGFNEAFWKADVTVESGAETVVKLGHPEKACVVMQ